MALNMKKTKKQTSPATCRRCGGRTQYREEFGDKFFGCMNCGHREYASKLENFRPIKRLAPEDKVSIEELPGLRPALWLQGSRR